MIRLARQLADAALAVAGDIVLDLIHVRLHRRLRDDYGLAELERRLASVETRVDEAEVLIHGRKAAAARFTRKAAS
jgi:hypothetical protein